jgi:hypothetical protein
MLPACQRLMELGNMQTYNPYTTIHNLFGVLFKLSMLFIITGTQSGN